MKSQSYIGFDRIARLKWLQKAAYYVSFGEKEDSVRSFLLEELKRDFGLECVTKRGSLDKTLSILMRIWVKVPESLKSFRNDGLKLLSELPGNLNIAVHWGMVMAVYPFWGVVAAHVGRLLRLQGTVSTFQITTRIIQEYGQRPTVRDALRRILSSMLDWGVLSRIKGENGGFIRGIYRGGIIVESDSPKLIAWLAEALIRSRGNKAITFDQFLSSPAFFPVKTKILSPTKLVNVSERLEILEHGLNQELLVLSNGPAKATVP